MPITFLVLTRLYKPRMRTTSETSLHGVAEVLAAAAVGAVAACLALPFFFVMALMFLG